jgi:hypothetical protein
MSESNKNQSKEKPVRTDAPSKADPQTKKQPIVTPKKDAAKPLKANDRPKDDKRTQLNG